MVAIIDYGAGNVQSVKFAFNRLGVEPILSHNIEEIRKADHVIFPGVGHAQTAMDELKKYGLEKLIPELKQPVLGICLGMQLLCDFSEEGKVPCLGIIPGNVKKLPPKVEFKIPHMTWNTIQNIKGKLFEEVQENDFMYFVHSYYVPKNEHTSAVCDYVLPFSAAIEKNNFYACQFHPEKSGKTGEHILKNFLELR
ncbi:MAG: imidazole glycerol phosphate synthase subunit HisH [Flavobacteriales bacterium]|nr:MAG: imidazole glycerol phosphate synthase subunit HisH [Flavobacteriales bacterium]